MPHSCSRSSTSARGRGACLEGNDNPDYTARAEKIILVGLGVSVYSTEVQYPTSDTQLFLASYIPTVAPGRSDDDSLREHLDTISKEQPPSTAHRRGTLPSARRLLMLLPRR